MLDKLTNEAVNLLCRMIEIPSISRDETAVANLLEDVMQNQFHLTTHRHGNNIWSYSWETDCTAPDDLTPTILLNAHIDTVKPTSRWTKDPFKPTIEGDRIYGLGSNDDGASVVSLLQAFRANIINHTGLNIIFLASCEEEISGRNGIESVLSLLPNIDVAIVGEPTNMQPAIAEKGLMVVDAVSHGKSGHSARDEGENAIYNAMDDITWLRNNVLPRKSDLLGAVKTTTTIINAGTQHNVIPDRCTFTIDIRSNEYYSNEEILTILRQHLHSDLIPRSTRLSSSYIHPNHPLVQTLVKLGRQPFGSPTLSDQALMSFQSMKIGPGQSSRSHIADEFICISEIREAIDLYQSLLADSRVLHMDKCNHLTCRSKSLD